MNKLACALLCAALGSVGACAVAGPTPPSTTLKLARDVVLIPGGFAPGHQPDGNTVVWSAPQGLVVLDTGRHSAHTQKILDFAVQSRRPVVAVVNSHWHLDHISGNQRLRAAFPQLRVYAGKGIEAALTGFLARSRSQSLEYLAKPGDPAEQAEVRADVKTIESGVALYPDVRITEPADMTLAGRRLRIGLETFTVTEGDVWIYDPGTRIIAAGDLVTMPAPFFDTACPTRWQSALSRLQGIDFKWLVPGHGEPMTPGQFSLYRQAFDSLLTCAASPSTKQACVTGWQRDVASLLKDDHEKKLAGGLIEYYLDVVLRADPQRLQSVCGNS